MFSKCDMKRSSNIMQEEKDDIRAVVVKEHQRVRTSV